MCVSGACHVNQRGDNYLALMGLGSFEIESFEICCHDNLNRSCFLAQAFRSNTQSTVENTGWDL